MSASTLAAAYSATGGAWQAGPGRIYDRMADVLVAASPVPVAGRRVLDLGAGTGAASRAALAAGAAAVVAVDIALGMLAHDESSRPPAAVGDSLRLPFAGGSFGAVVAAFSLNHLTDPAGGLAEAARVLAPGGGLAASAYATDDTHPVKEAVERACAARGWTPEPWYTTVRHDAIPRLATVERARAAAAAARLPGALVDHFRVPFPGLSPDELVAWRLGMAHVARFQVGLSREQRAELAADALERLGSRPPALVRSVIILRWTRPA